MNPADRPPAVRRWLRRPLLYLVAALGLAAWLTFIDAQDRRKDEQSFSDGLRRSAQPDVTWDGGRAIDLTYTHPSGQVVRASTYVWHSDLLPSRGEPIEVMVSRTDPTDVRLVGDRYEPGSPLQYLLFGVPPLAAWATRRRSMRQSVRSAASDPLAYQMRAVASSPGWWSARWRLHLYPLDASAGSMPVCTVPLIAQPAALGERMVEVKGSPRSWGRVVARDQATGEVLWPSGRCLRSHGWGRRSLQPGQVVRQHPAVRWLLVAGLAVGTTGAITDVFVDDSIDVEERGYRVPATVVDRAGTVDGMDVKVHLEWLGDPIDATVNPRGEPDVGDRINVFVDPVHPSDVWAPGEYAPGGDLVGGFYAVAMLLLAIGAVMRMVTRRRSQQPVAKPPPPPLQTWLGPAVPPPAPPSWPGSPSGPALPPPPPPSSPLPPPPPLPRWPQAPGGDS